jgi:hypothetical protein
MTAYRELTSQVADQWIAALRNAEQLVGVVSEGAQRFVQAVPAPSVPEFAPFEKLNEVISEQLPKPREVVEANFEFTSRLLTAQRDLTLKVLEVDVVDAEAKTAQAAAAKKV